MPRYAMIDDASQIVVNVIEWDGNAETWRPPPGYSMVEDDAMKASPGFSYDGTAFAPPPEGAPGTAFAADEPESEPQPTKAKAKMIGVTVILNRDVPPLDRVEMEAVAAAAWDFPIEDVVIDIDGVRQPKTHVEVGDKNLSPRVGLLTIVNKTRATWPEGAEMTASWPDG